MTTSDTGPNSVSLDQNQSDADIEEILREARLDFERGLLTQSRALYEKVLARQPHHAQALHGLGLVNYKEGQSSPAIVLIERAIAAKPDYAEACLDLAKIYAEREQWDEAVIKYLQVINAAPALMEAHYNLAVIYQAQHRLQEAKRHFQQVLINNPNDLASSEHLGDVLRRIAQELGAVGQAQTDQREAASSQPQMSMAMGLFNQGIGLEKQGMLDAAMACYQQAIEAKPDLTGAYNNVGTLLMLRGLYAEALINFINVVSLEPNIFIGHCNISNVLRLQGRFEAAAVSIQRAIALEPNRADLYSNFALLLKEQGMLDSAAAMSEKALQLRPDFVDALLNLGHIRILQGRVKEGIEQRQLALKLNPNNVEAESALFISMHYLPDYSPQDIKEAAKNWAARHASPESCLPKANNIPDPRRRLRIGYVSGDFFRHPVAGFIEMVLAYHDKSQYEVYCYYNNDKYDNVTERLQKYADHWRVVAGQSNEMLARQIRSDGIDILIDLTGHTDRSRLLTFALKPAPVQATWIGAPTTTGMTAMDYIIADRFAIPASEESNYVEQVMRLPNSYMCYAPPDVKCVPAQLPALVTGKITFGCFNNTAKITEQVIACWSRLLRMVPDAHLYLKYKAFGDAGVQRRYLGLFASNRVDVGRIKFSGAMTLEEHFSAYNEVDIALDPFPYNGATTTVEALWMGVPVVSLQGDRFIGRMGETLLKNVGLEECVVDTEDAYVAKAAALAADLPRLAELRNQLRLQMLNSPLCDGQGFTRDLEVVYRNMWETWCKNN